MKKTVLFLDDEARILEGLQRMLRHMRKDWDMVFEDNPHKALQLLSTRPVDVVVSDVRMPAMDGVTFLGQVKDRFPGVARIILSGHADESLTLRSVKIAHQYLAKPCEAEALKATVARACAVCDLLNNNALQAAVAGMDTLPSLPTLYSQIMTELQSPDASVQRIGEIVAGDPAMTAKILQVVNSAFFGLRRRVSDPAQAVNFLGLDTIRSLVLAIGIFSQFNAFQVKTFSIERLWGHCIETADLARTIARCETETKQLVEDAFLAGLLHDTGKLVLVANAPDLYRQALEAAESGVLPLWQAEQQVFGASHAEVGAYLMGLWGLPDQIVAAIAFHHQPAHFAGEDFHALTAVHGADALLAEAAQGHDGPPSVRIDPDYLARLKLTDHLDGWRVQCRGALEGSQ